MDYLNENLVDYIFNALVIAKKALSILPHLPPDTKPVHLRVLHAIYRIRDDNGNARITDINKSLQFLLPNPTKFINELHNLGLVEKSTLPTEARCSSTYN
jgi:DNA-binding MarR family transcriptional regulator